MRLPFRKKEKKGDGPNEIPVEFRPEGYGVLPLFPPTPQSAWLASRLPPSVLERIFAALCPHARDDTYEPCEESGNDKGCTLCDLRNLAHCVAVSRAWRVSAVKVLYHSVRIDPVHYCKLEAWLAERRKKGRFEKNAIPEDPAQARLRLFRRTVRDDPTRIGKLVQFLKIPYMLREYCHVELAQTIAVLPNLHYVDLPEGMFADEPSFATLRLEVQARCPNIRKTSYLAGSERSFASLATGQVWPRLQVLEITRLNIDPMTMRQALGSLGNLRALKISETDSFSDEVLLSGEGLPALPPLEELVLKDTPNVTAAGLVEYLAWIETQQTLKVLTLKETGVHPAQLRDVLIMATSLKTLALQCRISEAFPQQVGIEPLTSQSLRTLRFEISGKSSSAQQVSAASSYYSYLSSSILSGNLPKLRRLYVHDESFPEKLQVLPPPPATFAAGHGQSKSLSSHRGAPGLRISPSPSVGGAPPSPGLQGANYRSPHSPRFNSLSHNRYSSNNPFTPAAAGGPPPPMQTLEIFTKSDEFGQWNFARVDAVNNIAPPAANRPISSYGLATDVKGQGWDRGTARRSIMVGNGTGGFLTLPGASPGEVAVAGDEFPLPLPSIHVDDGDLMRPRSYSNNSLRAGRR